jgi:integrase
VGTRSALFNFAKAHKRRWARENPCDGVELPDWASSEEIHYLEPAEIDALIGAVAPSAYAAIDTALFRAATMTGLRQGELIALRWRDVDWKSAKSRVRRNYVRGQFGTPKSKRAERAVPLIDELGGELERLFEASEWQKDDDLVFADPHTGGPLERTAVLGRFRDALKAARLDESRRFHDLRHTFGTRMAAAGVPMRTLQEWMGHRNTRDHDDLRRLRALAAREGFGRSSVCP